MSTLTNAVAFEKYHGTGNDFIIVDATDPVPDRSEFATTHCDRSTGVGSDTSGRIGADGVLFLHLEDRFSPPRIIMTLVQPDGSVAPICGNGARCAAVWAMDRTDAEAVMIDTQAGTRRATRVDDGIAVEMGEPTFDPSRLPLTSDQTEPLVQESVEGLTVTAVNTGVPHAVAFVDDIESVDIEAVAAESNLTVESVETWFAELADRPVAEAANVIRGYAEGGVEPLSADAASQFLQAIPAWELDAAGQTISRKWKCKNFVEAMEFLQKIGTVAEQEQHHPDLHLTGYNRVRVTLTTHAIGGLSENDFIVAAKLDRLAE
jgi:diaminopimelate epimerase